MTFFSIVYYVAAPLLILFAVNCTYNVFFHHLRRVPGPRLAALTRCWLFILEIKGHAHEHIRELHKIYGPIVRIAPGELSINDHDAYGQLYGQGSKFYKAQYYYSVFEPHGPNIFSLQNKEAHLADKRLMSNAFSRTNVLKHEEAIYEKVQSTMERIAVLVQKGKPVPLVPAFWWLTLATICDFAFGKTIDMTHSDDFASSLFEAFDRVAVVAIIMMYFPFLKAVVGWMSNPDLSILDNPFNSVYKASQSGLQALKDSDPDLKSTHPTMFQSMIENAQQRGIQLSDRHLLSEAGLVVIAGTDTTAATLSLGLFHLMRGPELCHRLHQEVRGLIPFPNSVPSVAELENIPLLDACIKESLRLTCPVKGRLPRVTPPEGWTFQGHHLKAGTIVAGSPLYECYDEQVFPDPCEYKPERWLADDTTELNAYLHPFSRGARQCIGQNLSMIELRIAFSQFVRRFTPLEQSGPVPEVKDYVTPIFGGPGKVYLALAED